MYQSVSPNVNFVEQEKKIEAFWEEEHIFEKSIDSRKKGTPYVFYDGPPTANGKPHVGHVLTRVIKDIIPRYKNMQGYRVPRKAGWDTHGLPVELEVEKKLGISGKDQIDQLALRGFGRCGRWRRYGCRLRWRGCRSHAGARCFGNRGLRRGRLWRRRLRCW